MISKNTKKTLENNNRSEFSHRFIEVLFLGLTFFALFLFLALVYFDPTDPSWSHTSNNAVVHNAIGYIGALVADLFLYFLGYTAFLIPISIGVAAWLIFSDKKWTFKNFKGEQFMQFFIFIALLLILSILLTLNFLPLDKSLPENIPTGGMLGKYLSLIMLTYLGFLGSTLLLIMSFLICMTLLLKFSWLNLMDVIGNKLEQWFFDVKDSLEQNKAFKEAPAKLYKEPTVIFEEPATTFETPATTFETPATTFETPVTTFE